MDGLAVWPGKYILARVKQIRALATLLSIRIGASVGAAGRTPRGPLSKDAADLRTHVALQALDRYLETRSSASPLIGHNRDRFFS